MYVTVHRGARNIGGSLIEIGSGGARLLFDVGSLLPPLDGDPPPDPFQLEGLTWGRADFQGVFLSHHHGDHTGLLGRVLEDIPVHAGRETQRILTVVSDFTDQPRPRVTDNFQDGQPIPAAGGLTVTPLAVPHSARDAYMFLVQGEGRAVLYTGDFRSGTGVLERVRALLEGRPLDLMICEGTNIRPDRRQGEAWDEGMVERMARQLMGKFPGPVFVLCSSTNEDRIQALCRASEAAGRQVYEDFFQTAVRGEASQVPYSFNAWRLSPETHPRIWPYFQARKKQGRVIAVDRMAQYPNRKTIFVRKGMAQSVVGPCAARSQGQGLLIYSVWSGYQASGKTRAFLDACRDLGLRQASLHASGHVRRGGIQALAEALAPVRLLPIHCPLEDRPLFQDLPVPILPLDDGQRWDIP